VTCIRVFCSLRAQISRSICNFTHYIDNNNLTINQYATFFAHHTSVRARPSSALVDAGGSYHHVASGRALYRHAAPVVGVSLQRGGTEGGNVLSVCSDGEIVVSDPRMSLVGCADALVTLICVFFCVLFRVAPEVVRVLL
jgi:hypothetical protein